jgi:hypothetical protein
MLTHGIDLHKRSLVIATLDSSGALVKRRRLPTRGPDVLYYRSSKSHLRWTASGDRARNGVWTPPTVANRTGLLRGRGLTASKRSQSWERERSHRASSTLLRRSFSMVLGRCQRRLRVSVSAAPQSDHSEVVPQDR